MANLEKALGTNVLEPVYHRVDIQYSAPTDIDDSVKAKNSRATKRQLFMGRFYEGIARGFVGGELNDVRMELKNGNGLKPDVIDWAKKEATEVKGSFYLGKLEITAKQFLGYQAFQYQQPDWQYRYSVFRHALSGIRTKERSEEKVLQILSKNTKFALFLPLSFVADASNNGSEDLFDSYYNESTSYDNCFILGPGLVDNLFSEPEKVASLLGLKPEDYIFERYMSPDRFRVNRRLLRPFPILWVKDRDHERWAGKFMEGYERRLEKGELDLGSPVSSPDDLPF